jgi:hypothetical protein
MLLSAGMVAQEQCWSRVPGNIFRRILIVCVVLDLASCEAFGLCP